MKHEKPVKKQNVDTVSTLTASFTDASSVVFVDYTGMDMKSQQGLMKQLKGVGSSMVVAKNTFIKIAAKKANLPEEVATDSVLSGQTALVVATGDPVAPLQILGKFMAESDKPKWKVGVVEGHLQDAAALSRISKLPGKEQLVAQVIGGISAPLYGLVGTLNGNIQKLVWILSQKAAQE